jgi:hypothetical protein
MTGQQGDRETGTELFDGGGGPLGRFAAAVQGFDGPQLVGAAALAGLVPFVVGLVVAAAGGFAAVYLTVPGTYLLAATLGWGYLLALWAVRRYPGLWAEVGAALEGDEAAYRAVLGNRVGEMTDTRLLGLVPLALAVAGTYDLLVGIPKMVNASAIGGDQETLLMVVNYGYGLVGLVVLVLGLAALYHHLRLVEEVTALPVVDDHEAAAADFAALERFDATLAAGLLVAVGLFLAHLTVLVVQFGGPPGAVVVALVQFPILGATVLVAVVAASLAYLLPQRSVAAALDTDAWTVLPLGVER